ncbi:MAG: disulfide bond formation protein DsbA [Gammaproteobacteria bacterium]|nr:disulfide bond formation protein DsbA [Gammaproteobacteria bacterium]
MSPPVVVHYFDYKSPYAYLAQAANDQLEREFGIQVTRLPYTLDIPSFLGRAEVDASGRTLLDQRNDHQWRRVRYAYMDCRREATRRGLILRGPRKVFDSAIAHIGFLYACEVGVWRAYHEAVFSAFWRRELDLENPQAIAEVLAGAGAAPADFLAWLAGEGRTRHTQLHAQAETAGIFGVPSWQVDGELFWGPERLDRIGERIAARLAASVPR